MLTYEAISYHKFIRRINMLPCEYLKIGERDKGQGKNDKEIEKGEQKFIYACCCQEGITFFSILHFFLTNLDCFH